MELHKPSERLRVPGGLTDRNNATDRAASGHDLVEGWARHAAGPICGPR